MDAIRNIYRQPSRIFLAMTPSQRAVVVCVSAIVTVGLALVIKNGWQPDSHVPLSWGKKFDRDELIRAEQTLTEAGLSNFRTVGQQILVPSSEAERYNAELLTAGHLPANPVSEFEKQFEKNGLFPTRRAMDESRDIALRNTLRGVLLAIPEIQDASVLWARDTKRSRWQDPSKVTATVNVRPRAGKELSLRLIHSLFVSVAAMVPDLDAKDVVVLDQSNGRSYLWDTVQQSRDNRLLNQESDLNEWYRSKILNAISFIQNVRVSVSVALRERLPSQQRVQKPRESKSPVLAPPFGLQLTSIRIPGSGLVDDTVIASSNDDQQLDSFISETETSGHAVELLSEVNQSRMAKSVHVVVSIPEDYYQMIASNRDVQRDDSDYSLKVSKIRTAEISKVESIVEQLVFQGSPSDSVSVSSYFRIGSDNAPTMSSSTSNNQRLKWGSVVGLSVGAVLLLWFLVRGFNRSQSELNHQRLDSSSAGLHSHREDRKDAELSNHSHPRERLQTLVQNDLDSAATIVSKWIQATS